jgi:hypothetical protein
MWSDLVRQTGHVFRVYSHPKSHARLEGERQEAAKRLMQAVQEGREVKQLKFAWEEACRELSWQELADAKWEGVPFLFEHTGNDPILDPPTLSDDIKRYTAGEVYAHWQDAETGDMYVAMRCFDNAEGRMLYGMLQPRTDEESGEALVGLRGCSITHWALSNGATVVAEISLCWLGKRPGTGYIRSEPHAFEPNLNWAGEIYKQKLLPSIDPMSASIVVEHQQQHSMASPGTQPPGATAPIAAPAVSSPSPVVSTPAPAPAPSPGTGTSTLDEKGNSKRTATTSELEDASPNAKRLKTTDERTTGAGTTAATSQEAPDIRLEKLAGDFMQGKWSADHLQKLWDGVTDLMNDRNITRKEASELKKSQAELNQQLHGYRNDSQRTQQVVVDTFMKLAKMMKHQTPPALNNLMQNPAGFVNAQGEPDWNTVMRNGGIEILSKASIAMDHGLFTFQTTPTAAPASVPMETAPQATITIPAQQLASVQRFMSSLQSHQTRADQLHQGNLVLSQASAATTAPAGFQDYSPPPAAAPATPKYANKLEELMAGVNARRVGGSY